MPTIAIVTGASSGLGREFVRLIDAGEFPHVDEIWAVARRAERLDALVRTCSKVVRPFCLDLTDPDSYELLESSLSETPAARVALLVNNAGTGSFGDLASIPREDTDRMLSLLVRAPIELIYRTLPFMREGSRIINVASVAAFIPQPRLSVYSAAKRFILDVSRSLDVELSGTNIHVSAVCPKFMNTEFLDAPGDTRAARKMCRIGFENVSRVAHKALRAARAGRSLCIPSADMKALYALSHVAPYPAAVAIERLIGVL